MEKHGKSRTREYRIWISMKSRCLNPGSPNFSRYGGRGISVCERWVKSFSSFLDDMGEAPSAAHSLDRIDNDGNYEPNNCRWATRKEQQRNRSNNHIVGTPSGAMTAIDAAEAFGLKPTTVWTRLHRGKDDSDAISPLRRPRVKIPFRGKLKTLTEHAKDHGVPGSTAHLRMERGWSLEEAITFPIAKTGRHRKNAMISFRGETLTKSEWARRVGITYFALHERLKRGWSLEKALTTPKV